MNEVRSRKLEVSWLGRIGYEQALARQDELVLHKVDAPEAADHLLLLEHEPVYTIGRTSDQSSLRVAEALPHPLVKVSRGGQATYHGPGQLVGYPIVDLRTRGQDLHAYLRSLEEVLIIALQELGIPAERKDALTGVWVRGRKVASIGVGVRRWVSMHGFALNVNGNLAPFEHITPCGLSGVMMTTVEIEAGRLISVEEMSGMVAQSFRAIFGYPG